MAVLVGVARCHEMGILHGLLRDAEVETRLCAFVPSPLVLLKVLLDLLLSLLAAFYEPLEPFATDYPVGGPAVQFLGSPGKKGDCGTCSRLSRKISSD